MRIRQQLSLKKLAVTLGKTLRAELQLGVTNEQAIRTLLARVKHLSPPSCNPPEPA
jgi:hypothetical protein